MGVGKIVFLSQVLPCLVVVAWQPLTTSLRREMKSAVLRSAASETDEVHSAEGDDQKMNVDDSIEAKEPDPRDELRATITELENELRSKRLALERAKAAIDDSGKNGLYRLAAQVETYKRNNRGSAERSTESRKADVFRAFTPVLEAFESASSSVQPENEAESKMHQDFQEIYRALMTKFSTMGMESYAVEVGTLYDPELHQAHEFVEAEEDVSREIIQAQLSPGYKLKTGAIIRPALCLVARPSSTDIDSQDDTPPPSDDSTDQKDQE